MEFEDLLAIVSAEPVFETGVLLAGATNPVAIRVQLSRWVRSGKVVQIRRGLYALAPPYRQIEPHPFVVANRLSRGSYVSLQSALSFYALIPELVAVTTSVTLRRGGQWETPLGVYITRHVHKPLFWGYEALPLGQGQRAFVARPEKALLDLLYLEPGAADRAFIDELRLQNLDLLDPERLLHWAEVFGPKVRRAATLVIQARRDQERVEAV